MKNPLPGVYEIEAEKYFQLESFSNSDLKLIARSPAHYYAERLDPNRKEKESTPAQVAGTILHTCILEPEKFDEQFVVLPEDAPRRPTKTQRNAKKPSEATMKAITFWDGWEEMHGDKTLIAADDMETYQAIASEIRNHPEMKGFMRKGRPELTFVAEDPETGLRLRCRPDWTTKIGKSSVVIDFKSTRDARPDSFSRDAWNYGYFQQAAFYLDVMEWAYKRPDVFLFCAFEKEPPYAMKLYEATDEAMLYASKQYREALNMALACINSEAWPAYSTDIEPLALPGWIQAKLRQEDKE